MSKRFIGLSILACAVLASSLLANGPDTPPNAEDVYGLKTWIEENVSAADVSAEIEGAVSAHAVDTSTHGVSGVADVASVTEHVNATGTAVHGLGTMATEAKTDYVATGTFTGHTGDASDPHGSTLTQTTIISDSVDGVDVSAHVTDNSDVHGCTAVASASAVADALSAASALIPNNASFTLAGLSEKSYSSLTGKPSFGTMASETATNYVATSTLTAHENDTSTHGVAQVAGIADVSAALSAANASDALNLRLDGSRAMTGSLKFSGNYGILQSTSDGSDSGEVNIGGGGAFSVSRGAYLRLLGNESTNAGQAQYYAGNVSTGDHIFYTGAGTERFRIAYNGTITAASYLRFSAGYLIGPSTSDGSDNQGISLCGGGGTSGLTDRGGLITLVGNESGGVGGSVRYYSGTVETGHHMFYSGNPSGEKMRLTYGGNLLIGTTTDDGTNKLQVNGGVSATKLSSTRYMTVGQEFYPITASGGIATFTALGSVSATAVGHLYVTNVSSGHNAILYITESAVTKVAGNAAITHAKGTSSSINVYVEGGYVMIQNNISSNRNVAISYSGMKN